MAKKHGTPEVIADAEEILPPEMKDDAKLSSSRRRKKFLANQRKIYTENIRAKIAERQKRDIDGVS